MLLDVVVASLRGQVMDPPITAPGMEIALRPEPDGSEITLELKGELDVQSMYTFRDHVFECLRRGHRHLSLDMAGVTRCEEAALHGIAGVQRALRVTRGRLHITEVSEPVLRAFHDAGPIHHTFD